MDAYTSELNNENNIQNGEQHDYVDDQQLRDELDVSIDIGENEHEMSQYENLGDTPEPPQVQIWRSNRHMKPCTR
ncbi:hypothetical protein Lal_00033387 [Lupinus albus]|nr:hypothetical protein Lal_00033387 [Lupinus albus]